MSGWGGLPLQSCKKAGSCPPPGYQRQVLGKSSWQGPTGSKTHRRELLRPFLSCPLEEAATVRKRHRAGTALGPGVWRSSFLGGHLCPFPHTSVCPPQYKPDSFLSLCLPLRPPHSARKPEWPENVCLQQVTLDW